MRKNRLIALIGTLTMAAAGLAAVSAGVSSKKAEGVSADNATDVTVYCLSDQNDWYKDQAGTSIHHWGGSGSSTDWPGAIMENVEGNLWKATIKSDEQFMFVRTNKTGGSDWGAKTATLTFPTNGNNEYHITSVKWDGAESTGSWEYYGSYDYYIVGSEWNNWSTSTTDMPKFAPKSDGTGEYEIKNVVIANDNAEFKYYYIGGPSGFGNPNKTESGPTSGDYKIGFNGDNGVIEKAGTYNIYLTPSNGKMWFNVQKYDVTYDVNGATSGSNSTVTGFIAQDFTTRSSDGIEKDGYAFSGWNTKNDGTGTNYAADAVVDLGLSAGDSTTLYAKWVKVEDPTYTVLYHSNEGSDLTASQSVVVGQNFVTKAANTFTKPSGKKFKEWNTSSDGKGTSVAAGATTSSSTAKDGTYNLYAIWELNNPADGKYIEGTINESSTRLAMSYDSGKDEYSVTGTFAVGDNFQIYSYTSEVGTVICGGEHLDPGSSEYPSAVTAGQFANSDTGNRITVIVPGTYTMYYKPTAAEGKRIWVERITYTITYHPNNGTQETAITDTINVGDSEYKTMNQSRFDSAFTRVAGKKLLAWTENQDGSGTAYPINESLKGITQGTEIEVYAKWVNNSPADGYYAYLDGVGYTPMTEDAPNNQWYITANLNEGDKFKFFSSVNEVKEWYGYSQYKTEGGSETAVHAGQLTTDGTGEGKDNFVVVVPGEYKIYVATSLDGQGKRIWIGAITFKVTYAPGDGGGTEKTNLHNCYVDEDLAPIVEENSFTAPTTHKEFDYWSGSDGKTYNPGDPIPSQETNSEIVLTAIWKDVSGKTITLEKNGGEGGDSSIADVYDGDSLTITTAPTKTNNVFDGYWTESTGGVKIINADKTSANPYLNSYGNKLYAHWIVNNGTYITGDFAGGFNLDGKYAMVLNTDNPSGHEYVIKDVALDNNSRLKVYYANEGVVTWEDDGKEGKPSANTAQEAYPVSIDNSNNLVVEKEGKYDVYFDTQNRVYHVKEADHHEDGFYFVVNGTDYYKAKSTSGYTGTEYTAQIQFEEGDTVRAYHQGEGDVGTVYDITMHESVKVWEYQEGVGLTCPDDGVYSLYLINNTSTEHPGYNLVSIFKENEEEAVNYARDFLKAMDLVCKLSEDDDGNITVNTVLAELQEAWLGQKGIFDKLSPTAQTYLKGATAVYDEESTDILGKFAARYDYIYGKYHASLGKVDETHDYGGDFAERNPKKFADSRLFSVSNVSTSTWIIASVAIVGIAAVGVFFIYRKRKEN